MTDMEKSEILYIWHVCDVENVAIYAKFMQFSCGEKLSPKVHLWRKNDEYQVCVQNMKGKKMSQILFIRNCNINRHLL